MSIRQCNNKADLKTIYNDLMCVIDCPITDCKGILFS